MTKRIVLVIGFLLPAFAVSVIMAHRTAIGPLEDALWEELPGITHVVDELGYAIPTPIPVILSWNHPIGKKELLFLREYTEYLKRNLSPGWEISSLANYQTRTWDESWGEKMEQWSPYVNLMLIAADEFSMETWEKQIAANPSVYGKYVDKKFQYLTIQAGPPKNMNMFQAIREFRRVAQRNYPPKNTTWYEYARYYVSDYLDADFTPYREIGWPEILVGSTSAVETLITWAFFVDVDIKILLGYLLLLPFLFLVFRDPEYALPVWLGTLFAFLAALASIWPLSLLHMRYSVFLLPTLVGGVMIASLSFNAQLMEDIKRGGGARSWAEWNIKTESVKKSVLHIFRLTLICFALFGFFYQSLWIAIVMDTVLAIGALCALMTQRFVLPALYFFIKERSWRTPKIVAWSADAFENMHARLLEQKVSRLNRVPRWNGIMIHGALLASLLAAGMLAFRGYIDTNSRQIEFLGNSNAKTMLNKMAELGRLDVIPVYFESQLPGDALGSEEFFQAAKEFLEELQRIKDVGSVSSLIDQIDYETNRTDGLAVPYAKAAELTRFGAKESHLTAWTEWKNGVFMWADHPMDNAVGIDEATRRVEEIANRFQAKYPWLMISLFGNTLHYATLALITAKQAPWALLASLFAIFFYYTWMTRQECRGVPALKGGFVIAQPFLFVSAAITVVMALCDIPLNIATAVIIPIVISAAADANIYPAEEFFLLLKQKNAGGHNANAREVAKEALGARGKAVNIDCAGNMLVLGLLLLSSFTPVWHLGMLSCLALAASRWWSINFTLPQLACLHKQNKEETGYENNPACRNDYRGYAGGGVWLP